MGSCRHLLQLTKIKEKRILRDLRLKPLSFYQLSILDTCGLEYEARLEFML